MYPSNKVAVVLGGNVTFNCVYSTSNSESMYTLRWLVNGSSFEGFSLTNVVSKYFSIGGGTGLLSFFDLPLEYNNTVIQCMVTLNSGHDYTSGESMLLLQGLAIITVCYVQAVLYNILGHVTIKHQPSCQSDISTHRCLLL